jgi:outer membrane protein with glycine zipper
MKLTNALAGGLFIALAVPALAQTTPSLANSMKLTVYPAKGQNAATQGQDEAECYNWSKQQTGYDPSNPPPTAVAQKVEAPPAQPTGARARGAVRGAAAGAVVGEIADNDAGKGAATGAAVGVVAGGARNRQAKREQEAQVNAANQQSQAAADQQNAANAQALANFKKGMGTCLEGKGYAVK